MPTYIHASYNNNKKKFQSKPDTRSIKKCETRLNTCFYFAKKRHLVREREKKAEQEQLPEPESKKNEHTVRTVIVNSEFDQS